ASSGLEWFVEKVYQPVLRFSLRFPGVPLATAITMLLITLGLIRGGIVPRILFPKTDNNLLHATVVFPDGTSSAITDAATRRMEEAIREVSREVALEKSIATGIPIEEVYPNGDSGVLGPVVLTYREVGGIASTHGVSAMDNSSGSNVGQIFVE